MPTHARDISVVARIRGELHVTWKSPSKMNGNVTHYYVYWQPQVIHAAKFDKRDYCLDSKLCRHGFTVRQCCLLYNMFTRTNSIHNIATRQTDKLHVNFCYLQITSKVIRHSVVLPDDDRQQVTLSWFKATSWSRNDDITDAHISATIQQILTKFSAVVSYFKQRQTGTFQLICT